MPHTAPIVSHRALGAAFVSTGAALLDNGASHQAGEKSAPVNPVYDGRAHYGGPVRTGTSSVSEGQDQVQPSQTHPSLRERMRSCAWPWDAVHALVPGAGSRSIGRAPAVGVLFSVFVTEHALEPSSMKREIHHINGSERCLWQGCVEGLVDPLAMRRADGSSGGGRRMCGA